MHIFCFFPQGELCDKGQTIGNRTFALAPLLFLLVSLTSQNVVFICFGLSFARKGIRNFGSDGGDDSRRSNWNLTELSTLFSWKFGSKLFLGSARREKTGESLLNAFRKCHMSFLGLLEISFLVSTKRKGIF